MTSHGLKHNAALLEAFQRGDKALDAVYKRLDIDRTDERFPKVNVTDQIDALIEDLKEIDVYGLGRDAEAWQSWIDKLVNDFRLQDEEHRKTIRPRPKPHLGRRY